MNKKTLLTLALYLYGITTQINAESVTENTTESVVWATPAEQPAEREQLALTREEESALQVLTTLHNNNQLNKQYLQSFVESLHNDLNKNATSIEELNLCAVLEKQKQILTQQIKYSGTILPTIFHASDWIEVAWIELFSCAFIMSPVGFIAYKEEKEAYKQETENNAYLHRLLKPFTKKPIQNITEIGIELLTKITGKIIIQDTNGAYTEKYQTYLNNVKTTFAPFVKKNMIQKDINQFGIELLEFTTSKRVVKDINAQEHQEHFHNLQTVLGPFTKEPIQDINQVTNQLSAKLFKPTTNCAPKIMLFTAIYCAYHAYLIYEYYTRINKTKEEITILDAMIATIQEIEQSE